MAMARGSRWISSLDDRLPVIPDPIQKSSRIRADQVRVIEHPVLMGGHQADHGSISVVPILEGECIRYLRVQCGCGQTLEIECLYPVSTDTEETESAT